MSSYPASSSFPSLTYSDALTLALRGHSLDAVDARLLLQHVTGATFAQIVSYPGRQLGPVDRMRFESLIERRAALGPRPAWGARHAAFDGGLSGRRTRRIGAQRRSPTTRRPSAVWPRRPARIAWTPPG